MLETALAKLLTLKVGATALAVAATGGVALAAATGTLPDPLTAPSAKPAAHATGKPADKADQGKGSPAEAKGSPSPNLAGLCRAYRAGAGDNPGKALENPAFRVLITTAGAKEQVAAYCDTLLATEKGKARPTATPSHPTGQPQTRPTPAKTERPEAPGGHQRTAPPTN
ncbi:MULTISPECIES: hypothetical protein [Micromonospora]|jgi:hypothetical protein|uniref:Uncharacterized protein n=1 Tax=Micromonospora sicca TaxID=2202420 RepID=A0A317DTM4_9ACTN|nr:MULTISPECIES: hypothetical protein [unclassified Micromonospora]MBM0226004.1 hypothetical protein [Micromonospora sp. ATA51]PWR17226.1 hypothetical protein DKT69_01305 [Micromonospora sp. 4G51]